MTPWDIITGSLSGNLSYLQEKKPIFLPVRLAL